MTSRDAVLAALAHETVRPVPYTLPMEDDVSARLDSYYGDASWRERLAPSIIAVGAVDTDMKTAISETHVRDAYGGIWRTDRRPWHLEQPPLPEAEWGDYVFPSPDAFYRPDWKAAAVQT
ncbi:MAG TPA: hypothetical protein VGL77_11630, partial [Armatimonadota bacterium]